MAANKTVSEVFPVSNKQDLMPKPSTEECLSDTRSVYIRSDLPLCVRTLKVIEQLVFSRTNSTSGPLTICLSIAGIAEFSPSFVSVQNALGLSLSYNVTESYRLRLIAEREKASRGAWDTVSFIDENTIPSCQFDNWDILPLRAVKAHGKVIPKVNGALLQGVGRKRKKQECPEDLPVSEKRQQLEWQPVSVHGDRESFAGSFSPSKYSSTINGFNDIVFGIFYNHRQKLTGSVDQETDSGMCLSRKNVVNFGVCYCQLSNHIEGLA